MYSSDRPSFSFWSKLVSTILQYVLPEMVREEYIASRENARNVGTSGVYEVVEGPHYVAALSRDRVETGRLQKSNRFSQ